MYRVIAFWRVHIQADDVLDLLDELRIVERLKVRMRLQPMRLPQTLHGAQADTDGFGHIVLKNPLASATRL